MGQHQTAEDLRHAITNCLGLISSHAQYLLSKEPGTHGEELRVICDQADRAAVLLALLPSAVPDVQEQDPPPADSTRKEDGNDRLPKQTTRRNRRPCA